MMPTSLINTLGGSNGFGTNTLGSNDDGSTSELSIGSIFENGLNFYGTTYNSLWINNNGNVTFDGSLSAYTPELISSGTRSGIFAYWADVDTRGEGALISPGGTSQGSNLVYYDFDVLNDRIVITWDDVGYYFVNTDSVNAFQMILTDASSLPGRSAGDFDIEFRYEWIDWTAGDLSGGEGGIGGTPARAGYSSGTGVFFELPQSGNESAMLDLENTLGNTGREGVWRWSVVNGNIGPTPPDPQVLTFDETLNEGEQVTLQIDSLLPPDLSLPFPGSGSALELISAINVSVTSVSGTAINGEDYNFSYTFGQTQTLQIDALTDALVEDDETAVIRIQGTVDWIIPNRIYGIPITNAL
jgi:hypothetical protein